LEDEASLIPLYEGIGTWLRERVSAGWKAWVITSSKELSLKINLKTFEILDFKNGALDCRLLGYEVLENQTTEE
jgi:23S rRNA G2445 N2-methylase RlmL